MKTIGLIVLAVAVLALVADSEAVSCYVCSYSSLLSSGSSSGCQEFNFSPSSATTQGSCTSCMKTVSSADGLGTTVTRECLLTTCTESHGSVLGVSSNIYCCSNKDNCNSASAAKLSLIALISLTLLALFAIRA